MGAVTRRFRLTKASTRGIALAVSTLALGVAAFAPRAEAYIYFGNTGTQAVARADLNGTFTTLAFIPGGRDGVAVDSNYIYFSNSLTGTLGRATLDGKVVIQNFITGAHAYALAVDDQYIYWTNQAPTGADSIGRANVSGGLINQTFIPSLADVRGIAVDNKHIYWTSGGGPLQTPTIGRANLDGSNVDPSYITGPVGDGPYTGLAVNSKFIYWTNVANRDAPAESGAIGRATLDATQIDMNFIAPAPQPAGVAVHAGHLYWANSPANPNGLLGAISRANLNGRQADPFFISLPPDPDLCCATQLAVDALSTACAGEAPTIAGTGRADRLRGTKDADVVAAGKGDDTVVGLQGDDLVCGGRGDDTLRGAGGDDTLRGGRGKDELRGGGGSNICRGGRGADSKHHC